MGIPIQHQTRKIRNTARKKKWLNIRFIYDPVNKRCYMKRLGQDDSVNKWLGIYETFRKGGQQISDQHTG